MKKTILIILIILSPLSFFASIYRYYQFNRGLVALGDSEYEKSREIFEKLNGKKVVYNKNLAIYLSGEEPMEGKEATELFNRGNYYYKKEKYQEAKESYWQAMLLNDDINIKKNYELALKKLEEENKQEQEKQEQQEKEKEDKKEKEENQDKESQDKESQDNPDKGEEGNQSEKDSEDESEQSKEEQEEKKDEAENQSGKSEEKQEQEKQNTQENQSEKDGEKAKSESMTSEELKEEEAKSFLKLLDKKEMGDLKNNHRMKRQDGGNSNGKQW